MTEPLEEAALSRTGCKLGHYVVVKQETESTNDDAHELAASGGAAGAAVVAELQTKGRGRLSRSWLSPAGKNLLFSLVLPAELARHGPGLITLSAGVAVARALRKRGVDAAIKWPNDVRANGRKLAGILCESGGPGADYLVAGMGINVDLKHEDLPAELREMASSLFMETGRMHGRAELFKDVLAGLERELARIDEGRQSEVLAAWTDLAEMTGRRIKAHTPGGVLSGRAAGVRADGALLLDTVLGQQAVIAGDIVPE
ncbi:MAG: biotin--[acetyl-CoA-carboxylase] ligase [bacterium]